MIDMKPCIIVAMFAGLVPLCGCAPKPYMRIKGKVSSATAVDRPAFDSSGLRLMLNTACYVPTTERWCTDSVPGCVPEPVVIKKDPVACPLEVVPGKFSLRTPWGQVYPGTRAAGALEVKIAWSAVSAEAVADLALTALRSNWVLHADDGVPDNIDVRLALHDDELHALLAEIARATANDYSEAPEGQHAALAVAVSDEPSAGGKPHVVVVSVTNRGPDPAYRVVVRLASTANASVLQGLKRSFGRVNSGETKNKTMEIAAPAETDDPHPVVELDVASSNAAPVSTTARLRLKPDPARPVPPRLACASHITQVVPGQSVSVECEAENPGDVLVRSLTYRISVGEAPASATGPQKLEPHTSRKFENEIIVPANAPVGSSLPITIVMDTQNAPPVPQTISLDVIQPHKLCEQGALTIQDYRRKRARLDKQRAVGNLTPEEFNDDLAELWSCVRR